MKALMLRMPAPTQPLVDAIAARAPALDLVVWRPDITDSELDGVTAALGWSMPAQLLPRLPDLRWVCSVGAGVEKLLAPELPPRVTVSRIVDPEQSAGIAQYVVLMALRHARSLKLYEAQQVEHRWTRQPIAAARSRVAVLGVGAMGGEIASWLTGVGFEVEGWSRRSGGALEEVLARNDIVVCALPLTPATEGLLDATAFAAMPRGSYLINVARGAHVVEPDLIDAIARCHLSGAALDVQRTEPLPATDPLWTAAGITITPHIAAQSSNATIAAQFVDALGCFNRGEAVPNAIERARGY